MSEDVSMPQDSAAQAAPSTTDLIQVIRHQFGVVELVLNRLEAMNAVSTAMAQSLTAAAGATAADESTRAVVVSSSHPRRSVWAPISKSATRSATTSCALSAPATGRHTAALWISPCR